MTRNAGATGACRRDEEVGRGLYTDTEEGECWRDSAERRVVLDVVCFFVRLRQGPLQRCWNAPVPNKRKGHSIQIVPIVDLVPIITLANIHILEENMP